MAVIARYALATLPPLAMLLLAGPVWGGLAYGALIWLTLLAALGDVAFARPGPPPEEETAPWADGLSVLLALGHLGLILATPLALMTAGLTFGQGLALLFGTASFFGQVSHPNAHELIHRRPTALQGLGALVYASVAFGHHVSAHRLVHHAHVGTDADPNTPRPGEGFWAYLPRAWGGSFAAGLEIEIDRLERRGRALWHPSNPYWLWVGGALVTAVLVTGIAGIGGLILWGLLAGLTGLQILMSDYVQHYGLQRLILPDGRVEPVAAHHSWNAPRGFSSFLMMNAPAHSEHHMHPTRPYDRLDVTADVPTLPYGMPIMAILAMVPGEWRRIMDKRALRVMEAAQARHGG